MPITESNVEVSGNFLNTQTKFNLI